MEIGDKIKKVREMRNFTQEYMAHQLGISQAAYSKIEHGEIKIKGEKLTKIAEILQVDTVFLESFDDKAMLNIHSNYHSNIYNISFSEKAHYEKQISLLEKQVEEMRDHIQSLKEEISYLRK